LKDLDIKEQGRKLYLPPDKYNAFINQLEKDSKFLSHHRVMDYSLLLGIYYPTDKDKAKCEANLKKRKEGGTYIASLKHSKFQDHHFGVKAFREDGKEEIYYIGIIDVLIEYAAKKKVEHLFKSIAYAGEEVSVVEPELYRARFDKFIKELVFTPQDKPEETKESSESDDSSSETGETAEKSVTATPSPGEKTEKDIAKKTLTKVSSPQSKDLLVNKKQK